MTKLIGDNAWGSMVTELREWASDMIEGHQQAAGAAVDAGGDSGAEERGLALHRLLPACHGAAPHVA